MASPQPDQFTKLSNELLEQVPKFKLNGSQLRIIMIVWRYTYGFARKEAELSISFLSEATGIIKRQVIRELTKLIEMNVVQIVSEQVGTRSRVIRFNKDYESWKVLEVTKKTSQIEWFSGDQLDTSEVTKKTPLEGVRGVGLDTQERNNSLKKDIKEIYALFDQFYEVYPRKVSKKKAQESWNKLSKQEDFNPGQVIDQTRNFAETCKLLRTETKFIPHPSTFLNQKRYEDYNVVDPEGLAKVSIKTDSGNPLDRLLKEEMEEHGSCRRDITHEVHFGSVPELPDGR